MEIASSVLSKLGFDWQVALANLVNFLIVYFLLKKVVFNKLRDAILERKRKAAEAVVLREEAMTLHNDAQLIHKNMKKEVEAERRQMMVLIEKEQARLLEKTQHEITLFKEKSHKEALDEKQKIIDEAQGEILDLSKMISRKVLEKYQEAPNVEKIEQLMKSSV